MFDSTVEVFTLAAPDPLLVFGLCNLIIVILILSGLNPSSMGPQEWAHEVPKRIEKEEKGGHESFFSEDIEASSSANVSQAANDKKLPNVGREESDNEDEYEEEADDELRRRVEEFINKVNRGWKEERLMTLH